MTNRKYILGISAFYHDSAAALLCDGEIVAAAQEERFTRKKNDQDFPINSIRFCLDFAGIGLNDIEAVVFYEKPFVKFERILETYYEAAPRGLISFLKAMPVWLKGKLFMKKKIRQYLAEIEKFDKKRLPILFAEHHLSHAASAFFPSPFGEAAVLTVDGVGEWATCTISHGIGTELRVLKQLNFPHSLGLLYSSFTYFCGFRVNHDEYKLMGLAAYGNEADEEYSRFRQIIEQTLVNISEDGSIFLDPKYFTYSTSLRMVDDRAWERLFGMARRRAGESLTQAHCNLALAIQHVTEKIMLLLATEARKITGSDKLCLAGGVALNCLANGRIATEGIFREIFVQPASHDAGGALGAAMAAHHIHFGGYRVVAENRDKMKGSLLGPVYKDEQVVSAARKYKVFGRYIDEARMYDEVCKLLEQAKVIAWYQGRMEFGPRALGNRSILGDPRSDKLQKELNEKVKFRESFRPFAPIILAEKMSSYFNIQQTSPYMLLAQQLKPEFRIPYPADAGTWTMNDKLKYKRSFVPAVTHIDYTARLQSVDEDNNPKLYKLLQTFYNRTGCPMLINTSFNTNDEPIVNSPDDAFRCFTNTNIDYLVINNFIYEKNRDA